jgi:hypothetical protein
MKLFLRTFSIVYKTYIISLPLAVFLMTLIYIIIIDFTFNLNCLQNKDRDRNIVKEELELFVFAAEKQRKKNHVIVPTFCFFC